MIRFSKKLEYALFALQFLGENSEDYFSAREMSQFLNIPYDFLAKTLQKLARKGIVISNQGIKGGYKLNIDPKNIKLSKIFESLDESVSLVTCFSDQAGECRMIDFCGIRSPIKLIQDKINNLIATITLKDLINYEDGINFHSIKVKEEI